ncbi:MAG: PP2C family protein-serine/threonine phosphatase, partial [bacterium]|nr:PP2C family protein-serine/threonine phosphatase [bacterium]
NILASKLVNYVLLNERAERQLIEAELSRASSIQKKLLDLAPKQIDGYSIHAYQDQCRAVGGDMYDFCQLPDGRLVILVADVSGKGMGAALLMANVLASLRILYQSPQFDLVQSVQATSTQLFNYSAQEDFVTLFVGIIDPRKNSLKYINAGHNPAILVQGTGTTKYLDATGIMIGAFPGMAWDVNEIELNIGDSVCVYTDGVTEAEGTTDQYGEERLIDCLLNLRSESPKVITERLMENIGEFVLDCPQSDDITMLVVKREG